MERERGDQVDEKRGSNPNQRIDDAVGGEFRDAYIAAMCDGHAEECDAGDVGQRTFLQEVDEDPCPWEQAGFIPADGNPDLADDICDIHQRNDADGDQGIAQDRAAQDIVIMGQEQDAHTREPTEQCAHCTVQPDTYGTLDFGLQTDDRSDSCIERNPRPDIKKLVQQATDENRKGCPDDDLTHSPQESDCKGLSYAENTEQFLDLCFVFKSLTYPKNRMS